MGDERQILDFIFEARTDSLKKEFSKVKGMLSTLGESVDDAFNIGETAHATKRSVSAVIEEIQETGLDVSKSQKNIAELVRAFPRLAKVAKPLAHVLQGSLSKAMDGLGKVVSKGIDHWKDHIITMEGFRREAGLSRDDVRDFTAEVISASGQYGLALDKVASTALFLRKGLGNAHERVTALAASMENFNDMTGTSSETTQRLAEVMVLQMGVADRSFQKTLFGVRNIGREVGVSTESLMSEVTEADDFIRSRGKDRAIEMAGQAVSIAGAMHKQGASVSNVREVLQALGDQQSKLSTLYKISGDDIGAFTKQFDELYQLTQSADPQIAAMALQDMADRMGVSKEAAVVLAGSFDDLIQLQKTFGDTLQKSVEQLTMEEEAMLGPLKKLGRTWTKILNDIAGLANTVLGPGSKAFYALEFFSEKVVQVVDGMKYILSTQETGEVFTPSTESEKMIQAQTEKMIRDNTASAKVAWRNMNSTALVGNEFVRKPWDEETGKRFLENALKKREDVKLPGMDEMIKRTEEQTEVMKAVRDKLPGSSVGGVNTGHHDRRPFAAAAAASGGGM